MATRGGHKRSKFRELPGDLPRDVKIKMLERFETFYAWPWQRIELGCIRSFRRDFAKRVNRRVRRADVEEG